MKNFLTKQYTKDKRFKIRHNYLTEQFKDYPKIFKKIEKVIKFNDFTLGSEVEKFEKSLFPSDDLLGVVNQEKCVSKNANYRVYLLYLITKYPKSQHGNCNDQN